VYMHAPKGRAAPDSTQTLCALMRGVIQFGRVLNGQNNGVFLNAGQRRFLMRLENLLWRDFWITDETIRSFSLAPGA
jgi:hypothetical protein